MNMDADLFWSKYEEKFQEAFQPTEEKLQKRYGLGGEKKVSVVKKVQYERELRKARLAKIARFGNLSKVISRFSVKKISRSTKNANRRYMRMKVKVNRRALQKIYMQFVSSKHTVQYDRLIIHPNLSLQNAGWTDLGVSTKTVLEGALYESWQNWFVSNYSDIANLIEFEKLTGPAVEVAKADQVQEQESASTAEGTVETESGQTGSVAAENLIEKEDASGLKQLHLFIEASIRKTYEDELENYRGFAFKIYTNIIDGQTGELVASKDLSIEPQSFSTVSVKELSSNVASAIYNLPLKELERLKSEVFKYKSNSSKVLVKVAHFPSDLINLKTRIEEIGLGMGVQAQVVRYLPKESLLSINYAGQDERLTAFIARMNELEFVKDKGASVEFDPSNGLIQILVASSQSNELPAESVNQVIDVPPEMPTAQPKENE